MRKNALTKLLVFSLSLNAALSLSSCVPFSKHPSKRVEDDSHPIGPGLTGDEVVKSLEEQLADGLELSGIDFELVTPAQTIDKEKENGQLKKDENGNYIPVYVNQTIKIQDGSLKIRKGEELYFSASLPVTFNDEAVVTVKATYADSTLYCALVDTDTSLDNYSFKYKIGIESGSSDDEFSQLIDYLYDLIDKYGAIVLSDFASGKTTPEIIAEADETIEQVKNGLSIVEGEKRSDGTFDYSFNLTLNGINYPLTLNCESDGTLVSIDLSSNGKGIQIDDSAHPSFLRMSASSSSCSGYVSASPVDASSYHSILNVEGFLSRLYPLIKAPLFSGSGSLSFEHIVSKNEDGSTKSKETASLSIDMKADISNLVSSKAFNNFSNSVPNAISTDFGLTVSSEENGEKTSITRDISLDLAREKDENGDYIDKGFAYLTTSAIATKMDYFTLDTMIGKIMDLLDLGSKTSLRGSLTESKVSDIKAIFNKFAFGSTLAAILDDVLNITGDSSALKGLENGAYESFFKLIRFFGNKTHSIAKADGSKQEVSTLDISLDLAGLGLSGTLTMSLYDGSIRALAGLSIENFAFGSILVNGEIYFNDEESLTVAPKDTLLERNYLRRLPDLFDGIQEFTDSQTASLSFYGSVLNSDGSDGFEIEEGNAKASFDIKNKNGTGEIIFKDRQSATSSQNYRLGLDVKEKWEDGHMVGNESDMFFLVNTPESKMKPLAGYFSIDSLNGILSLLMAFSKTEDEQFTKYLEWIQTAESSSLISRLINGNELNPLLSSSIIRSFQNDESKKAATVVINGGILSLDSDLDLEIGYKGDFFSLDGVTENTNREKTSFTYLRVKMAMGEQNVDLTIKLKDYEAPGAAKGDNYNWGAYYYNYQNGEFIGGSDGVHDKSNYVDWSSIQYLLQYILNSALLGRGESYQFGEDGITASVTKTEERNDYSTYYLSGAIAVSAKVLGIKITTVTLKLDLYVYLKGAEVKVYGFLDTPAIIEVNGGLFGGNRFVSYFAYETDENNPEGVMYIDRLKENKLSNSVRHKVAGKDFMENIGDWVLGFMMGMFEGSAIDADTFHTNDDSSSESSPIYVENVFTGNEFSFSTDENGNPAWNNITLNIGGFGVSGLSGNVSASLYGNKNANTLSQISLSGKISYKLGILDLNANVESGSFSLKNVSASGVYSDAWGENQSASSYDSMPNGATGFAFVKSRCTDSGRSSRLPITSFPGTFSGKGSDGKSFVFTIKRDGTVSSDYKVISSSGLGDNSYTRVDENWEKREFSLKVSRAFTSSKKSLHFSMQENGEYYCTETGTYFTYAEA